MEFVTLRTGKIVPFVMFQTVTAIIKKLFHEDAVLVYELAMLCRDPEHTLFGDTGGTLEKLGLVSKQGQRFAVNTMIKEIVLALVVVDGLDMRLVDPREAEPTKPATKVASLDDYKMYCAVRKVADLVWNCSLQHGVVYPDRRPDGKPNPFYNQTASGLFIEHCYHLVTYLWTPWGKYSMVNGGSGRSEDFEAAWRDISGSLVVSLHQEGVQTESAGYIGPVYAVNALSDGTILPPALELDRKCYDSREIVDSAWSRLTDRYQKERRG